MTNRQAEAQAHDDLRAAIRAASLALWDRHIEDGGDEADDMMSTRPEIAGGLLIDYAVVALYDGGSDTHTVMATLRTDGQCALYRTAGLLQIALRDL